MLTKSFLNKLEAVLSEKTGSAVQINRTESIGGGSINQTEKLITSSGNFFLKWNSASRFPGMFEAEAAGLNLLRATNAIGIPAIIAGGEHESISFLILEMIPAAQRKKDYYETLGFDLAVLHKNTADHFGLNHHNYIGSLHQANTQHISGVEFMINERYQPLVQMAFESGLIDKVQLPLFDNLYKKINEILPDEIPSLLHGDLWNGNVITGPDGKAWLIDPAVYYGYRETDIAMMLLFGGFDEIFYSAYEEAFPLPPGWKSRIPLFQLYPLLVHLNLFGKTYRGSVMEILNNFR